MIIPLRRVILFGCLLGIPRNLWKVFGKIDQKAFRAIRAELVGRKLPKDFDFPTIFDGPDGMLFIDAVRQSSRRGARWVKVIQS